MIELITTALLSCTLGFVVCRMVFPNRFMVVCVDASESGGLLTEGRSYQVVAIKGDTFYLKDDDEGDEGGWLVRRFHLDARG